MNLTIIVPLFNESDLICTTLDRLLKVDLPFFVIQREIIIVDDCSTDGSFHLVNEYIKTHAGIRLFRHERNKGKGAAVRTGAMAASGDTLLIQDADLELDPSDIGNLLTVVHDNNLSLAGGSRFLTGHRFDKRVMPSVYANRIFSKLASLVSGQVVTDLTCGYKVINRELFIESDLRENRFGFETELMMKIIRKSKSSFKEVPVSYIPRTRSGGKKIRIIDGLAILSKILYYGLAGKKLLSALTALLTVLIVLNTVLNDKRWTMEGKVIEWDAISYYAYLPATFIYHDPGLTFIDGYQGPHKFIFWPEKSPTGKYVIKTTMGLSFLYMPFFAVAHVIAHITGADTGGFSEPYKIALLLSAVFFLALGLYYLRKLLLEYFSDFVTALVVAGFVFGTNLLWYSIYQSTMSHVYSFALIACFLWQTIQWHHKPSLRKSLLIGVTIGLITLIRPSNIIIAFAFIFYGTPVNQTVKDKIRLFGTNYRMLLAILITSFLVWVPQMIYWRIMTGHFLFFSYTDNERFFFNNPQIINGLFSYRKGLFIYTPLMILSFAGIYYLWKQKSPFALALTIFLPLNIYIIYSWWCWWYGGSFGSRPFIDCYAFMALPVGSLLYSWLAKKRLAIKIPLIAVYALVIMLGLYYNRLYINGAIHWDSMTKEAFFDSFGRMNPSSEFNNLLAEPDYEKAKEGIQATKTGKDKR